MKFGQKAGWFLAGILVAVLALGVISPAMATWSRNITIDGGIRVFLDDKELHPVDVKGTPVDVFAYKGTTYLPVRAISNAFHVPIQWDQDTTSVYIGHHETGAPSVMLTELDYFTGTRFEYAVGEEDNLGNTYDRAIVNVSLDNTYLLGGNYTAMSGTLFLRSWARSSNELTKLWIYGDGELLYETQMTGGMVPAHFKVDLTGVDRLNIYLNGVYDATEGAEAALADVGFWS